MRWSGVALVPLAAVAVALLGPSAAGGHSIVRVSGGELTSLSADATSLNTLTVRLRGGDIELSDPTVDGGMDPGSCRAGRVDGSGFIVQAFCPRSGVSLVRLDAGDREDRVTAELPIPVALLGGDGADTLRAGPADDTLAGDAGDDTLTAGGGRDTLMGGLGIDALDAGAGDDAIRVRDGLADTVRCGDGSDTVDADTLDEVAGDCERVERTATVPPEDEGGGRDRTKPTVQAGGPTVQRIGAAATVRVTATTSERGTLAASGFLDVGGLNLPLQSRRERVTVAGGGAQIRIRLSSSQVRRVRAALRRSRRVTVRLGVVATDAAGNSAETRAPRIRLTR
ncbi:MAG: Alkaline phosphatase [uncultured Solirubrobacteraceae bacterium]|uniref:Alkaline phosphatase n=1 Tax=uncultured Solirubrobacteraceae bacterium TaxID=1162706 RepID=A0A6J4TW98_9ACTN|nr:MAG: Alkaline phosphatase [uncultured Solirubrobacteraceae bacterium]